MLTFDGWFTLVVLIVMFVLLAREVLGPDVVMFGALVVLWLAGVVETGEAIAGFSNPQVLTIGLLFVVAAGIQRTGALDRLVQVVVPSGGGVVGGLTGFLVPAAGLSALLNNTPIVAMLTPLVRDWARRRELPPSKFLIPLSYAAIVGGTCTLIGTSTNLVVSGLLVERGYDEFGMFELSIVGVPATVVGLAFLLFVGHRLLPDRVAPDENLEPEYSAWVRVLDRSPLVDHTVSDGGLRHLKGLFLVDIERGDRRINPVRSTDFIRAGDLLGFVGRADSVAQVLAIDGVRSAESIELEEEVSLEPRRLCEIVVAEGSRLVGRNLRELNFRRRYDAAVIAIHRDGQQVEGKLGDVRLRGGDTLLLETAVGFHRTFGRSTDFIILTPHEPELKRAKTGFVIIVLMVAAISSGFVSPLLAAAVSALAMLVARCISPQGARQAIDLSVLVLIASSFGISAAVEKSGLAAAASDLLAGLVGGASILVALALLYLATTVVTELLSNNAAAALVFPIGIATATSLDADPRLFAIVIAIAASMAFITPLGYQTNLIVYGPGGYKFSDFARVGVVMSALCFIVCLTSLWLWFDL